MVICAIHLFHYIICPWSTMPDINALNIIKVVIHSLGTEQTGDSDNCCTNRPTAKREDTKQEADKAERCYTNT